MTTVDDLGARRAAVEIAARLLAEEPHGLPLRRPARKAGGATGLVRTPSRGRRDPAGAARRAPGDARRPRG